MKVRAHLINDPFIVLSDIIVDDKGVTGTSSKDKMMFIPLANVRYLEEI